MYRLLSTEGSLFYFLSSPQITQMDTGYLYSTNDYMKNHYFVGTDIRENGVRFRKSHIKKIKLVSCLSINKHYKLGDDK